MSGGEDDVSFLTLLPMAVVMVAGPQFVSAVFLATSRHPKLTSTAFLVGVGLAVVIGLAVFYLLADLVIGSAGGRSGGWGRGMDWAVLALLAVLAILVYRRRGRTEPPRWMVKLQTASPRFAFRLGFLLFLLMPTDIATVCTVAVKLARAGLPVWEAAPFVLLTLLLAGLPLILLILLGDRATPVQSRLRDWTNRYSWVISEVVILFFAVLTIAG